MTQKVYLEFANSNWYAYWETDQAYIKDTQTLMIWYIGNDELVGQYNYAPLKKDSNLDKFKTSLINFSKSLTDQDIHDILCAVRIFLKGVEDKFP